MRTIVQKYGGSSLATNARVRRVAEKVVERSNAGDQIVVVVSARGETTDTLMDMAAALGDDPPQRELDILLSAGEQISRSLLALAIDSLGKDVVSLSGPQAGIRTNDRHLNAEILRVEPERIHEEMARGRIVVVAGFQGLGPHGEITTLGRGGSDTTAVALAAALDADRCEICSDVAGVLSSDPRKVPNARPIPNLAYEEMYELARQGACVLHYRAVRLAAKTGVEIIARSTFEDDGETRINASSPLNVSGIAYRPEVLWVRGKSRDLSLEEDLFFPVPAEELVIRGGTCPTTGTTDEILVPLGNVPVVGDYLQRVKEGLGCSVDLRDDCGTVTAVGRLLNARSDIEVLHHQLSHQGIEVLQELSSERAHTWVLPRPHIEGALRQVHQWLFEGLPLELAG